MATIDDGGNDARRLGLMGRRAISILKRPDSVRSSVRAMNVRAKSGVSDQYAFGRRTIRRCAFRSINLCAYIQQVRAERLVHIN